LADVVTEERIKTAQMQAEQNKMRADITATQSALAIVESLPPDPIGTADAHDPPRLIAPAIVRIYTSQLVALEAVSLAIHVWLEGMGYRWEAYAIEGGQLGKRFTVRFNCANGLGAQKAKAALSNLKIDGVWTKHFALRADGARAELFISPDKLPETIARERATKTLSVALGEVHNDLTFYMQKRECTISLEWKDLAILEFDTNTNNIIISWNVQLCNEAKIDRAKVEEVFADRSTKRKPPWG
jgi:hypothetical protein